MVSYTNILQNSRRSSCRPKAITLTNKRKAPPTTAVEHRSLFTDSKDFKELDFWKHNCGVMTEQPVRNHSVSLYDNFNQAMQGSERYVQYLTRRSQGDGIAFHDWSRHIIASKPTKRTKLKQLNDAIAGIEISFETEMTDFKEALLKSKEGKDFDIIKEQPTKKSLKSSNLAVTTCLAKDPTVLGKLVPLQFSVVIKGRVKINPAILGKLKPSEINSCMAKLFSATLEKGLPLRLNNIKLNPEVKSNEKPKDEVSKLQKTIPEMIEPWMP